MFTADEREALATREEDIFFGFSYQVGIMMEDHPTEENQSIRHVEITWVGHSMANYAEEVTKAMDLQNPFTEIKNMVDRSGGPIILNYRFIKEFTKGVEDTWSINALNHFFLYRQNFH